MIFLTISGLFPTVNALILWLNSCLSTSIVISLSNKLKTEEGLIVIKLLLLLSYRIYYNKFKFK